MLIYRELPHLLQSVTQVKVHPGIECVNIRGNQWHTGKSDRSLLKTIKDKLVNTEDKSKNNLCLPLYVPVDDSLIISHR